MTYKKFMAHIISLTEGDNEADIAISASNICRKEGKATAWTMRYDIITKTARDKQIELSYKISDKIVKALTQKEIEKVINILPDDEVLIMYTELFKEGDKYYVVINKKKIMIQ